MSWFDALFPGPTLSPHKQDLLVPGEDEVLLFPKDEKIKEKGGLDGGSGDGGAMSAKKQKEEYLDARGMGENNRSGSLLMSANANYAFYLDVARKENVCIMLSYFCVGVALYLTSTPVNYYLVEYQGASSTQIGVLGTVQSLPWSFKVFYGLLSDSVPILGYKRKPYLCIGWAIYVLVNIYLCVMGEPGVVMVIICSFIMTCALLLADVCTDTLCVERARLESNENKGSLQSAGYTFRAVGMVFGAVLGTIMYNKDEWGWGMSIAQIFLLNALPPLLLVLPAAYPLVELTSGMITESVYVQLNDVWTTLQLKAVWRPMIFLYIYNVMQIPNSAWYNFLVEGLDFDNWELGLLTISSAVMTWLGLMAFTAFFFNTSWRLIYIGTTVLNIVFSLAQLLLVERINQKIGIPDVVFALGDNTFASFVMALQYMPTCIMFVVLCPEGSEGTTYALLTTISNLAGTVASDFGSWMTGIWDVSNESLEAGDFQGVFNLTVLTSFLQIAPIVLVFLLPATKEEQKALRDEGETSWWGGMNLFLVVVASFLFTVGLNVYLLL